MAQDPTPAGEFTVHVTANITVMAGDLARAFDEAVFESTPELLEGGSAWLDLSPEQRGEVIKAVEETIRSNAWVDSVDWAHVVWTGAIIYLSQAA